MSSKKISLPSVPKNADRDTKVFLQSLKESVEKMSANDLAGINNAVKSYVLSANKKIRADLVGVIGNEMGVEPILDKIRGHITESELSKELGTRIEKIISNENAISEERLQRVADVLKANEDLVAERQARVQAITDNSNLLQEAIDAEAANRVAEVLEVTNAVIAERDARVAEIASVGEDILAEQAARVESIQIANQAIGIEEQARIDAIIATQQAIDAERDARVADVLVNSNAIATEAQARADAIVSANQAVINERRDRISEIADKAELLQSNIDAEGAERLRVDDLLAQDIVNETTQRQTDTGVLTEQFNGIYAQVNPDLAGDTNRWAGDDYYFSGVWSLQSARIEDGIATSEKLEVVTANINSNKATITQVNEALVTKNEVVANQINMLSAQMVGGYDGSDLNQVTSGLIYQERIARSTEFQGIAEQISLLSAGVGEQFDPFKIWHFNEDADGWVGGTYSNGFINVRNEYLASPVFDINGNMYRHIKLRIKKVRNPVWSAKVVYDGIERVISEPDFDIDGIATISIRMEWSGSVTEFSLQLSSTADNLNYYSIDWIAIGRPSPGASSAALLDEQRARSSADEALAQSVTALDSKIDTKTTSLSSAINQKLETLTTTTETNATIISGLTSRVDTELGVIVSDIESNYQTQALENEATATKLDNVVVKAGENTAAIQTEVSTRTDADTALSGRIDTVVATVGENTASITSEVQTRADADAAMSTRIDTVSSKTDENLATITSNFKTLTDENSSIATRLDGVFVQVNPAMAGDEDRWAGDNVSQVGVWSEQSARIEDGIAIGQRIDTLNASFEDNNALIDSTLKVMSDKDSALASMIDTLVATTGENKAAIQEEVTARTTEAQAVFESVSSISASVSENESAIQTEVAARTTEAQALSERIDTMFANVGENTAAITTEEQVRSDEDSSLSRRINTVSTATDANAAAVQTEIEARTTEDAAMSRRIDTLTATTGDNAAAIQTEVETRTTEDEALSGRIDTLLATVGENTASIETEQTARASEDEALSGRIETLVATTGANSTAITSEISARSSADEAIGERIDTIVTTVGGNTALIVSNEQAQADQNSALATKLDGVFVQVNPKMAGDTEGWAGDDSPQNLVGSWTERSAIIENDLAMSKRVDGLTTEVDGNKATITELNQTLITKNEAVASQVNRLAAQMVGGYNGDDLSQVTSGLIHQERTARATAVEGLAEQVSLLSAGVGEQFDSFEIWHFDKNHDGWVNGVYANGWINVRTETINSPVISVDGSMYRHVKLRIQKVGTPTWSAILTYAGGSLTAAEPEYTLEGFAIVNFYMEWSGIITGFNIKLASSADNLNYFKIDWIAVGRPSPGASHAALLREEKARADKDLALAQSISSLDSQINGDGVNSSSSIVQKLETTATKTDTNATDISNLSSTFNDEVMGSEGVVARNAETAASASAANARDISGVFAQVNPRMASDTDRWAGEDDPLNGVGVWSERSAIIEEGIYTAQRFDAVLSEIDGNKAAISLESKTRVDEIKALADQTETIRADFEDNAGVMQTQITANATATSALSTRTDTIQSTVGDNTASIQTIQESIDGVGVNWAIKADVNGVVGGIALGNDGETVDFIVRAGSFAIQGQSGSKSVPFVSYPDGTVIDGEVIPAGNYLDDTYIRRASIDTLDIKGNAVTVPVSAFTEGSIEVGSLYTTIQSLAVPSDMGHTMLNFNAIFNFPGYARVQSILCRIVKGGVVIADNIEVFFSEARSETRTSTSYDPAGHNHSASFSGGTYGPNGYQSVSGNVTVNHASTGSHSHRVDIANDNRNAGTFSLSRHDSTGVAGVYELQMRVSNGGTANLSQRYIHAMTMRR